MNISCQQFELYAAEQTLPRGREFSNVEEAQRFVDDMRDTPYWERNFDMVGRVEVYTRPVGYTGGSVGKWEEHNSAGVVEMADVHMCELYLCHEVAHCLTTARYGRNGHGPWFARTYLGLVYEMMGPDAYAELHAAFTHGGIDCHHDNDNPSGIQLGRGGM